MYLHECENTNKQNARDSEILPDENHAMLHFCAAEWQSRKIVVVSTHSKKNEDSETARPGSPLGC